MVRLGTNGFAVTSLVFGILPLCAGFLGILFGFIGLSQIKKRGGTGKGLAITGIVLGFTWLIGSGAIYFANRVERDDAGNIIDNGEVSVQSLRVGDCINWPDTAKEEYEELDAIPCSVPHDGEVYAVFDLPDGSYPGEAAVQAAADKGCEDRFDAYVSAQYEEDESIFINYLYPPKLSWNRGDQSITCIAESEDGKLTGSIRS